MRFTGQMWFINISGDLCRQQQKFTHSKEHPKEKRIDSLSQNILKNDSNNKKQTVEKSLLLASLSSQKKFDTDNNLVSPACVRLSNATQLMTTGGNLPSKKVTDEDDSICNNDNGNNENNANDNNSDDRNGSSDDNNDGDDDDDDLPAMIKVEPPDIRDIDGEPLNNEDYENSSSPKLVIDVPEDHSNGNLISSATKVKKVIKPQLQSIPPSDLKSSIKDDSSNHKYSSYKRQYSWLRSGKIPRPPNAFMIFANEWRRKLAYQHPLESNKDISVRLGMMWKNLTVDAKENYYKASRKADEDHKKKYPGYYYSPKEARIRKNLKLRNRLTPGSNNDGSNTNNNGHSSSNIDELTLVKVFMTNEKNEQVSSNTGAFAKGEQPKWRKISPKKAYNKFADHEKTAETDINDVNVSDSEMKKTNLKRENTNELLCTKLDGEIKKVKLEINNTEMDDESVEEQEEEDIHNRREYHNDGDGGGNDNCTNNEGESQEMIKDKSASVTVN
ncbi:uncharacterized protein LOC142331945 [Lycorma delicatula]|uniref:uncharacterized protein LOC142331945 n=1 Tax=Lycorma delicatula TaxID=130591 RepID=UPI003F50E02A